MTKHERKRIDEARDLALKASQGAYPGLERDLARAAELLDFAAPRRRTERERAAVKAKATKRQGRREKVAAIRAEVMARAGGRCEWCGKVAPLEWHHIIGAGLRRHRESSQTTTAICPHCHRDWERSNIPTLIMADAWAEEHGFSEARAAIKRRLDKVREARAAAKEDATHE